MYGQSGLYYCDVYGKFKSEYTQQIWVIFWLTVQYFLSLTEMGLKKSKILQPENELQKLSQNAKKSANKPVCVETYSDGDLEGFEYEIEMMRCGQVNSQIRLCEGYWRHRKYNILMPKIKKWGLDDQLDLSHNYHPTIYKEIMMTNFMSVQIISLNYNNIESIQSIFRIQAPSLQQLELQHNNITDVRSLRKAYHPNLTKISIKQNPITDTSPIHKAYFPSIRFVGIPNSPGDSVFWAVKIMVYKHEQIFNIGSDSYYLPMKSD